MVNLPWEGNEESLEDRFLLIIFMKLVLLTHNVRGLNDPDKVSKERYSLNSLIPKADVVLFQEHKMRGIALDNLGNRLMVGTSSWFP